MKGFSLLEFLVSMMFFLVILFAGYEAFDWDRNLLSQMTQRTRPEEESNYRLLILRGLLLNSSQGMRRDPMLEEAPYFFSDLEFGQKPRTDAFSVARPLGTPIPFQREGSFFLIPAVPAVKAGALLLLAGVNTSGTFDWNYARVLQVFKDSTQQQLTLQFLLTRDWLDYGSLVEVEINGFLFKDETLYWISPAGQAEPFLGPLAGFSYVWKKPQLKISWQAGLVFAEFTSTL